MTELVPASHAVAVAVTTGGNIEAALDRPRAADWPHDATADALRPLADHPADTPEGTFLVVHGGRVVGDCGWFGPPVDGVVDIGYGLAPSARGQGLGAEAVTLLLAWVASRGASSVRAEVLPSNSASLRLLQRLGFTAVGEHAGHLVLTRPAHGGEPDHVAVRNRVG